MHCDCVVIAGASRVLMCEIILIHIYIVEQSFKKLLKYMFILLNSSICDMR